VDDVTYYHNKDGTITANGHHYSDRLTVIQHCTGQHKITTMDRPFADRDGIGGIYEAQTCWGWEGH
jgi:hypothetical protein